MAAGRRSMHTAGFLLGCRTRSHDDARDTFKTLKNQHIGDASAHLYYEWAVLEHSAGNISKALGIIAKGMRADAQPARCGQRHTCTTSQRLSELGAQVAP